MADEDRKAIHYVTIRLDEQTLRGVEAVCDAEERTRSSVIRKIVRDAVATWGAGPPGDSSPRRPSGPTAPRAPRR